jgi:hypothetical protein
MNVTPRADPGYEILESFTGKKVLLYTKKGPVLKGEIKKVQGKFLVLEKDNKETPVALDTIASVYEE